VSVVERELTQSGPHSASRRRFLLGGGAIVVAVGVGGKLSFDYWTGRVAWVEKVLRRHLPGIALDEDSLPLFFRDVRAKGILGSPKLRLAVLIDQTVPVASNWVVKLRHAVERQERLVLTEFLLGSNFFRAEDPTRETITYFGRATACGNPFAAFRDIAG
jgi:hypothetical protein